MNKDKRIAQIFYTSLEENIIDKNYHTVINGKQWIGKTTLQQYLCGFYGNASPVTTEMSKKSRNSSKIDIYKLFRDFSDIFWKFPKTQFLRGLLFILTRSFDFYLCLSNFTLKIPIKLFLWLWELQSPDYNQIRLVEPGQNNCKQKD